jgi:hypothetical protein
MLRQLFMIGTSGRRENKHGAAPDWFRFLLAYLALMSTVALTVAAVILISRLTIG